MLFRSLAEALTALDGVELAQPVQANGVFARLPAEAIESLEFAEEGERAFYVWDEEGRIVRLMCSWDTGPEDVESFVSLLAAALSP